MRICHITSVHPRYDIRIFVKECKALATSHDVSLIVADSLGNESKDGVNIIDVGKVSGGRMKRMLATSQAIYRQVMQLKPHVVHFHDPELMTIGRKIAAQGIKVIYDVHEDVPKQVMNKHWIPKLLRPLISGVVAWQEKYTARKITGIVAATEIIAARFKQYNQHTIAIHNYPILAELNKIDVEWNKRDLELCYLGSISETRGIMPLLDALRHDNLTLELAGPYSNSVVAIKVEQHANKNLVHYHGVLNREEVAKLLARVKVGMVTLLPTPSYVESLPIKLLEYMLAGIPVVASNFALWQQYVKDNECGIMVNPENAEEISSACRYLLDNPEIAQQMGERGRDAVIRFYTWEQEQKKLLVFYHSI